MATILVVDDEKLVRNFLIALLTPQHQVVEVGNSPELSRRLTAPGPIWCCLISMWGDATVAWRCAGCYGATRTRTRPWPGYPL
jgi:DNA-binding NtrC family response regulator